MALRRQATHLARILLAIKARVVLADSMAASGALDSVPLDPMQAHLARGLEVEVPALAAARMEQVPLQITATRISNL